MTCEVERGRLIPQIPKEDLYAIARKRGVTDSEFEALERALAGESNQEIADAFEISEIAVRKRLGEVYRKFEILGRSPGKLGTLKQIFLSEYQTHQQDRVERHDLAEAPSISEFYGRVEELATLKQWIVDDNCRLVAVLGMGGIGKTTLIRHLVEQIQEQFERIIWESLATAPFLDELLSKILVKLSLLEKRSSAENNKIETLFNFLTQHRCLLILDETEAILRERDRYGRYRESYQNYEEFFKQAGQTNHRSHLLIASQEPPLDLIRLEKSVTTVRSLALTGLELETAIQIFQQQNCTGQQQDWEYLLTTYRGNPLYLKLVAVTIQDLFQGDASQFAKLDTIVIPERDLIENICNRLSPLEKEILQCLADRDEQLSLAQINESLNSTSFSETIESMVSLKKRFLLEQTEKKQTSYFGLQPVIKKYIKRYPLTPSF